MIITGNPLLTGASGKINNLVVKQYKGKTIVTSIPDMSRRKLSPAQKEINERMRMANTTARQHMADPRLKERACEMLQVPANQVYRAIVKQYMLTDGDGPLFQQSEDEKLDRQTITSLNNIISSEIPDAELQLFGNRTRAINDSKSDWDLLILTTRKYPSSTKWKLQEKLFNVTVQEGTSVNILLMEKSSWNNAPEYDLLRKRLEQELMTVDEFLKNR